MARDSPPGAPCHGDAAYHPGMMRFAASVMAGALIGMTGCAPGTDRPRRDDATSDLIRNESLVVADRAWSYHVYVPRRDEARSARPLVLVLHGSGGEGTPYLVKNHWLDAAEVHGFIAIAPDAPPMWPDAPADFLANPRLWNVGPLVEGTPRAEIDDLAFFDALVDRAVGELGVDRQRVFVAGHSGGASMAFRLAHARAERVAAIAAVSGLCWEDGSASVRAVPTLFIVGTADPLVPLDGGTQGFLWLRRTTAAVRDSLDGWAAALACQAGPTLVSELDGVRREEYAPCAAGAAFETLFIDGHGHRWPGGGAPELPPAVIGPSRDLLDATEAAWTFFARWSAP